MSKYFSSRSYKKQPLTWLAIKNLKRSNKDLQYVDIVSGLFGATSPPTGTLWDLKPSLVSRFVDLLTKHTKTFNNRLQMSLQQWIMGTIDMYVHIIIYNLSVNFSSCLCEGPQQQEVFLLYLKKCTAVKNIKCLN